MIWNRSCMLHSPHDNAVRTAEHVASHPAGQGGPKISPTKHDRKTDVHATN